MAVPSYTTDLSTFNDVTTTTGFIELTGYTAGSKEDIDPDLAIYGTVCMSASNRTAAPCSLGYTGTAMTLGTDDAIFIWQKFFAPNSLDTEANDGIIMGIGDGLGDYYRWTHDGSDSYAYGGWRNYATSPTKTTGRTTVGTPSGVWNTVGIGWDMINGISKGNALQIDIIRYGRGTSIFTGGETADYATFDGYALINDNPTTGRFGLVQAISGGYLYKGLMSLGITATLVDFRDSNVNITIDNTKHVSPAFNRIEVHNASSNVEWNRVNFTALGTVSRGEFEMVDNATVEFVDCVFTDMSTFIFQSNATLTRDVFNGCALITQGSASFDLCSFASSTNSPAMLVDSVPDVVGCSFTSAGTGYAIQLDTALTTGSYTLDGNIFTGYGLDDTTDAAINYAGTGDIILNITNAAVPTTNYTGTGGSLTATASFSLTLTDIPTGVQVTIVNSSTRVELQNTISAGVDIIYAHGGGETVDILLMDLDYDPNLSDIFNLLLPSSNSAIKFQVIDDLNFSNPA